MNLGGQMGLWVGYSVITIVEFLSLIILIGLFYSAKRKGPQSAPKVDEDVKTQHVYGDPDVQNIHLIRFRTKE